MATIALSHKQVSALNKLYRADKTLPINDFGRLRSAPLSLHDHGLVRVTVEITDKGRAALLNLGERKAPIRKASPGDSGFGTGRGDTPLDREQF